jgi:hypothetical protein
MADPYPQSDSADILPHWGDTLITGPDLVREGAFHFDGGDFNIKVYLSLQELSV